MQPLWCLESPPSAPSSIEKPAESPLPRTERPILCRRCLTRLADMEALFPMDADRVSRVFANPAGLLLEIVTARQAHNLQVVGPPTTEFTWYQGYAWEVAYCAGCRSHVGWAFGAVDGARQPGSFFGLLKGSIILG